MKLRAPEYYKDFKCIADRCRHSCCIGWEIDIDPATREKYRSTEIEKSICDSETPHFSLSEQDRCPHLDSRGLCRIILGHGEDFLCEICREHPRFYHSVPSGREVGVGMSCEEACRLILSSDNYANFVEVGETDSQFEPSGFDGTALRGEVYSILSRPIPLCEQLNEIRRRFCVPLLSDKAVLELLSSLEYLEDGNRSLILSHDRAKEQTPETEKKLERAFAYFVFRHCSDAEDADDFRASLGLALLCTELITSLTDGDNINDIARTVSEELEYSEENTEAIKFEFYM